MLLRGNSNYSTKSSIVGATIVCTALTAMALAISACTSDKTIPGLKNFQIGVTQNYFLISFLSQNLKLDAGLTVPVPGLDGATISVTPDLQTRGSIFQFAAPLESLSGKQNFYPQSGLPDGRPLPDIAEGTLPRWDLTSIKNLPVSFYLSEEAFAFFIPLRFGQTSISLPWQVSATIEDERQNIVGKVYLIPDSNGHGSGLFILLPYIEDLSRSLVKQNG